MLEMLKEAERELLGYPSRGLKFQLKRAAKVLMGNSVEPNDKFNWPNGLLAKGLTDYYMHYKDAGESETVLETLRKYYDRWIQGNCRMYYLDDAFSGVALIDLHRITGDDKYRKAADRIAEYLFRHETDGGGSLPYRPGQKNSYIFADGIGMVCPFLCKYGVTYGNSNAIRLAVTQIQNFVDMGMDDGTGLPYHGYQYESAVKYGIIGWTRGTGWLLIGMAEVLSYLEESHPDYEAMKQAYCRMVEKVQAYQLDGGLYSWQLIAKDGPVDTSGTAMILYAIARSINAKVIDDAYKPHVLQGREALWSSVKGGKVYGCLAECQGFSMYPQTYGAYPWSLGPALSLFSVTEENNI